MKISATVFDKSILKSTLLPRQDTALQAALVYKSKPVSFDLQHLFQHKTATEFLYLENMLFVLRCKVNSIIPEERCIVNKQQIIVNKQQD
jgi:hypothetical protein